MNNSNQLSTFWAAVWAVVWKDLQIEKHTRQTISVMIMFSLVSVIMFNFALEANLAAAREVATGLLWSTILLAGTLGLNRSLAIERENQTMEAVLMAPIDRSAIYAGKVISISLFSLALEVVLIFIFIVFFNKPFWRPQVMLILVMGTIGYIAAGVIVTSMTIQTRTREVLLPVLLLPLSLPLVLPASIAVSAYMFPQLPDWGEVQGAISVVAIYDLLMLAAGFITYHYVVES
ncbi:MAG: heme exporter protein CcmB [Chloroflexota bacterium]|nr:heme exporter protein CcmB [Anaerolineales bacterium]MCB8966972.1 heme exporter protein CcmB [Ardenticatenaceae bacterium]